MIDLFMKIENLIRKEVVSGKKRLEYLLVRGQDNMEGDEGFQNPVDLWRILFFLAV